MLPYSEEVSVIPRLYINFSSVTYKDKNLISSIDGRHPEAKFICFYKRIQYDVNENPLWIHYKCNMEQVMRFERGAPIIFQITTRDGTVLPQLDTDADQNVNPLKQSLCLFEITPYIRDGDYDNHLVETTTL